MIAPSTTTLAIISIRRSSLPSGSGAIWGVLCNTEGEEDIVHELAQELVVKRFARDQRAREDHRAGDVGEERGDVGTHLAARPRPRQEHRVARTLVGDDLVTEQRSELFG